MKDFKDKRVIMTGATGGIGAKVAKKLLKAGAKVVMLVQDVTKIDAALNIKNQAFLNGNKYAAISLNLKEPYQIEKKFREAITILQGHVDMLEWDQMMNLNVRASFQLVSLAVPFLKLSKGCITILSSNAGKTPQPGSIIFSTSMAMLNMLVETTALETAFFGIRVNAVAPGVTNTQARMKKDSIGLTEA
jgi:NAD(P)-dependent dehydrogenase (short-subunit alcohol dehydrogenase family)